jgi:hypothetical protein
MHVFCQKSDGLVHETLWSLCIMITIKLNKLFVDTWVPFEQLFRMVWTYHCIVGGNGKQRWHKAHIDVCFRLKIQYVELCPSLDRLLNKTEKSLCYDLWQFVRLNEGFVDETLKTAETTVKDDCAYARVT